ncbi:hypothetical protein E4U40_007596 [Claviceps sp. LM458 group G5]|nr:hypothetical protein E4U40_007596 [Claviceps sp. LM458 group G5]
MTTGSTVEALALLHPAATPRSTVAAQLQPALVLAAIGALGRREALWKAEALPQCARLRTEGGEKYPLDICTDGTKRSPHSDSTCNLYRSWTL